MEQSSVCNSHNRKHGSAGEPSLTQKPAVTSSVQDRVNEWELSGITSPSVIEDLVESRSLRRRHRQTTFNEIFRVCNRTQEKQTSKQQRANCVRQLDENEQKPRLHDELQLGRATSRVISENKKRAEELRRKSRVLHATDKGKGCRTPCVAGCSSPFIRPLSSYRSTNHLHDY